MFLWHAVSAAHAVNGQVTVALAHCLMATDTCGVQGRMLL
jgi:hypothetical protein